MDGREWISYQCRPIKLYYIFKPQKKKENRLENLMIIVKGKQILQNINVTFLELALDEHLNFKGHIRSICSKLSYKVESFY